MAPGPGRPDQPIEPVDPVDPVDTAMELLSRFSPDDLAEVEPRQAPPGRPTVVVVGQTGCGKSALVNALLDAPGLSPSDPMCATGAYLVFRRGAETVARARPPGAPEPVPIPVRRLRDWVTVPGDLPAGQAPPRVVEVDCPAPLLASLTLVDTPGLGGLTSAHDEIALAAARGATALLFVMDASAPFTAPELDFLTAASDTVDLVVFAVTKIDAHRGWRQVVADDRDLLRRYASRFADAEIVPVSALLFERAAALPAGPVAATLRAESHLADLRLVLQSRVVARASALHRANLVRVVRSRLAGLASGLSAELAGLDPGPGLVADLQERRDGLARGDGRDWQLRLRAELSRARIDTLHDVRQEIRDQSHHWRAALDRADQPAYDRLPVALDAAVHALTLRLFDRMLGRLRQVTDSALRESFGPDELAEVYAGFAHVPAPAGHLAGPGERETTVEDRLVLVGGVATGLGAGRLVAFVPAMLGVGVPALAFAPLSLGLGVLAARWMVTLRRQVADRNHHRTWLAEALAEVRATLESEVAAQFVDAEQTLTLALDQAIARRVERLDRQISQIDEAVRMDELVRSRRRDQVGASLALVREVIERLDAVLPELRVSTAGRGGPVATLARLAGGAIVPGTFGRPGAVPGQGVVR